MSSIDSIRPSSDLRNHYAEISKQARETRKPVYLTVNGRGDSVLMGLADYQQMQEELELLKSLSRSMEDVRAGRSVSAKEAHATVRAKLEKMRDANV